MKICVKPRIHISLISMHADGPRVNGGIGFALEDPKGILSFNTSDRFALNDRRTTPLTGSELEQLEAVLSETQSSLNLKHNVQVLLEGDMLTHYGMGSGTAIRLACLEALLTLNKRNATKHELIRYSNRGGTSGIGINTYFDGGFVFDLGAKNQQTGLLPSSRVRRPELPLLLDALDMPDWKVGLCIGKTLETKTQQEEADFFERTCPISAHGSYELLYHSLFGVYASLRENDLETFGEAIKQIQQCEWKRKERSEYGEELLKLESKLYQLGANCVGMSSLGPLLFFLALDEVYKRIVNGMQKEDCYIIVTPCSNSGREIVA